MHITRLRLLGFKSFVDPAELIIERGLTGVVGPNGCGKSNLLEALRWVMGEASHKSMRAAAMDDVIFSGTTQRPARNAAEVTIFIDNRDRKAPVEFNDRDQIEITRRIEREAGSAYRINGREARARDVKILFEDAATGARSPALVRQGQIGEIVNARPDQRRRILEDAAGVAGLHSRRHEAELRLKAAEANLARLTDIIGQIDSQVESLKRQARAARRYKDVSAEIRRYEALVMHLAWSEAQALVLAEEQALGNALSRAGEAVEAEAQSLRAEAVARAAIPPRREEEAKLAAAAARLRIELETIERDAAQAVARHRELETRAADLDKDAQREDAMLAEAAANIARLTAEANAVREADAGREAAEKAAKARLALLSGELAAAEESHSTLLASVADERAKRAAAIRSHDEKRSAVETIERRLAGLTRDAETIAARAPDTIRLSETIEAGQRLGREIVETEAQLAEAEIASKVATDAARTHRDASATARVEAQAARAERESLTRLLTQPDTSRHAPVLDSIRVAPDYEAALAAALGADLSGSLADDAPRRWREIEAEGADPLLPAEAEPLSQFVEAPAELARRIDQIGVVSRDVALAVQGKLRTGQRLVSREGDLWRWDGYVARAGAEDATAQRLMLRNQLSAATEREAVLGQGVANCVAAEQSADAAESAAAGTERALRTAWRETQAKLAKTREALTVMERAARETEAKLAALQGARSSAEADLSGARAALAALEQSVTELGDGKAAEIELLSAQSAAVELRTRVADARQEATRIEHARAAARERLASCLAEHARYTSRETSARSQADVLRARLIDAIRERDAQAGVPDQLEQRRKTMMDAAVTAGRQRQTAADLLAEAEQQHKALAEALKASQVEVGETRETKARIEVRLEGARQRRQDDARRIRDTLEVHPDQCLKLAGFAPGDEVPAHTDADRTLARLKADRERLGGVNLQAEDELDALSAQSKGLGAERADIEQAIAKLRGAIGELNKEGKARLKASFEVVDGHFQRLFATLFDGGEARLEMIEAEDPLEGGLEIVAKPPGKKPATLSLLSGGEQTLTALALIFAVFLTNPSPICVLDEVDAPLDDSNVDRFCRMMERMAADTATRFLVITHHPMTMTRMSRLFGVTMVEKGVSQLVSVDLERAQQFKEAV